MSIWSGITGRWKDELREIQRMAPGMQYRDVHPERAAQSSAPEPVPKEDVMSCAEAVVMLIETYGVEEVQRVIRAHPELYESPNKAIDRAELRRKFGIRRDQPDPPWFDDIEVVEP